MHLLNVSSLFKAFNFASLLSLSLRYLAKLISIIRFSALINSLTSFLISLSSAFLSFNFLTKELIKLILQTLAENENFFMLSDHLAKQIQAITNEKKRF